MFILYVVMHFGSGVAIGYTDFETELECKQAKIEVEAIYEYARVTCWSAV